jgi:hypothetical protein
MTAEQRRAYVNGIAATYCKEHGIPMLGLGG